MSLKSAVLRSKLMNSDCFFFRALRRIAFFLLGNIIHNSRMSHSFLRKSRFRCGTNNHVRIGREGIIKHLNLLINGKNNHITIGDGFIVNDGLQIEIVGDGNTITLGEKNHFYQGVSKIMIRGDNCSLTIGDSCAFKECSFSLRDNKSSINIGNKADVASNVAIISMESKNISIGDNLFCSYNTEIRNTDSHSVLDSNRIRINHAQDVTIMSDVWVAQGVLVLKGAYIAKGCIIGAKSMVTKQFYEENSLILGTPAVVKKNNVFWDKNRL